MKYSRWNPIHWLIALFSNSRKVDYTPEGGDAVFRCPAKVSANTRLCYWFRNPGHDFTAYIVGVVDADFDVVGYWAKGNWSGYFLHIGRIYLPYVNWKPGRWEFYAGWRDGGNFGFKFRRHS